MGAGRGFASHRPALDEFDELLAEVPAFEQVGQGFRRALQTLRYRLSILELVGSHQRAELL
ncbi:hypothetical protein D3C75_1235480 [compost metagenome]